MEAFLSYTLLLYVVSFSATISASGLCSPANVPEHGSAKQIWDWFGQQMIMYSCDRGYLPVGQGLRTSCEKMPCKSWTGNPLRCAASDCLAHYDAGRRTDGVYGVMPDGKTSRLAYCHMQGGGWTVFQRRLDASTLFYRDWADYKEGFGELEGNLWLGLDTLHSLTREDTELHVYLETLTGESAYARYASFSVGGSQENYQLTVSGYNGTAGDSLTRHSGKAFSTRDADHDQDGGNCAQKRKGGWWYDNCTSSNLNGLYLNGTYNDKTLGYSGTYWQTYKGSGYSYKTVVMKLRRKTA